MALSQNKWHWRSSYGFALTTLMMAFIQIEITRNINFIQIILSILATVIVLICSRRKHVKMFRMIFEERFNIKTKDYTSAKELLFEIQIHQIICYLKHHNVNSEFKIKTLFEMVNNEIGRKKLPVFIIPGLLLAMFIPIWSQFVRVFFDINQSANYYGIAAIVLVIVAFIISLIGGMYKTILDDINRSVFNRDIEKLKEILKLLQEVQLRYN